ncbi:MAG: helix-turn-helix transcriptional regulator [Nitrospinae bacterium]|nr:helix-turn-helix transcriptional regulator [Nitrospinota bacterium]
MLAFLLRRQRQINRLTTQDVAERMGSRSKTAYARYEQGKAEPSLSKLQELVAAINPDLKAVFHIA